MESAWYLLFSLIKTRHRSILFGGSKIFSMLLQFVKQALRFHINHYVLKEIKECTVSPSICTDPGIMKRQKYPVCITGKVIKNSEVFNNLHSWTTDLKSCVKKLRASKKSYSKTQTTLNIDYWFPKALNKSEFNKKLHMNTITCISKCDQIWELQSTAMQHQAEAVSKCGTYGKSLSEALTILICAQQLPATILRTFAAWQNIYCETHLNLNFIANETTMPFSTIPHLWKIVSKCQILPSYYS